MTQFYRYVLFVQETMVSPLQSAVNCLSKAIFKAEVLSTTWIAFPLPTYLKQEEDIKKNNNIQQFGMKGAHTSDTSSTCRITRF